MKVELTEVAVSDLKTGDEWHGDYRSLGSTNRFTREADGMIWRVINTPVLSQNAQLFWDSMTQECIVVPVQYMDGARGSRLYDPACKIVIRRDLGQ